MNFDFVIKIAMLVLFFGIMIGVGIYCRKCTGRQKRRPLADGVRLRHIVLFRGNLYRLRGTVRLEVRYRFNLDRHRQRAYRLVFGMGDPGQTHAHYDPTP